MRTLDVVVIALDMAVLVGVGLRVSRRQNSTDEYFLASLTIPGWEIGMSIEWLGFEGGGGDGGAASVVASGCCVRASSLGQSSAKTNTAVLKPGDYRHYVEMFREQEREATGKVYDGESGEDAWTWMQREIPWFDASDKEFEEMYYFRWYAWKKHLVKTPHGYVITEWLPKPEMSDGSFGALPDAAPFHIAEARWLREMVIAEDDARYWFSPGVDSHKYSDAMAATIRDLTLANGDYEFAKMLLPALFGKEFARGGVGGEMYVRSGEGGSSSERATSSSFDFATLRSG